MNENFTNIRSLLGALAEALNLIDPNIENHHQQTAYLAYMIGREAGLSPDELEQMLYAALLHDIGFVGNDNKVDSIIELERYARTIGRVGAKMIEGLPGAETIGKIMIYCQSPWREYLALDEEMKAQWHRMAHMASVIHLADVIVTVIRPDVPILNQVKSIREMVAALKNTEFCPIASDAFERISGNEYMWMDLRYNPQFLMIFTGQIRPVTLDRAVELTGFMSRIIDYRSAFTAMHSAGVSASAEALARFAGMDESERKMMRIAGHLHDAGKLRVPRAILEKPGNLTEEEFNQIKEHPYYTRLILMNVDGFEKIADWAGFHHEKLTGRGYPFHFGAEELDTGSRIMAVADIFSAITEVRPYRSGMSREQALDVLRENAETGGIDGDLVALLSEHYDEIDALREEASRTEGARYYESIRQGQAG